MILVMGWAELGGENRRQIFRPQNRSVGPQDETEIKMEDINESSNTKLGYMCTYEHPSKKCVHTNNGTALQVFNRNKNTRVLQTRKQKS